MGYKFNFNPFSGTFDQVWDESGLADYIAKDGSTTTTAEIPFAEGTQIPVDKSAWFGDVADGLNRPHITSDGTSLTIVNQLTGGSLYFDAQTTGAQMRFYGPSNVGMTFDSTGNRFDIPASSGYFIVGDNSIDQNPLFYVSTGLSGVDALLDTRVWSTSTTAFKVSTDGLFTGTSVFNVDTTNGKVQIPTGAELVVTDATANRLSYFDGSKELKSATVSSPLSFSSGTLSLGTVDISSNTNLAATSPVVLTGDTLSLGTLDATTFTLTSVVTGGETGIDLSVDVSTDAVTRGIDIDLDYTASFIVTNAAQGIYIDASVSSSFAIPLTAPIYVNLSGSAWPDTTNLVGIPGMFVQATSLSTTNSSIGYLSKLTNASTGNVFGSWFQAKSAGVAYGFEGFGETSGTGSGHAGIGVYSYSIAPSGTADSLSIAIKSYPAFPSSGATAYKRRWSFEGLAGNALFSGGVVYVRTSTSNAALLYASQPATHFDMSSGAGSLYVEKYLEVDNIIYADGGLTVASGVDLISSADNFQVGNSKLAFTPDNFNCSGAIGSHYLLYGAPTDITLYATKAAVIGWGLGVQLSDSLVTSGEYGYLCGAEIIVTNRNANVRIKGTVEHRGIDLQLNGSYDYAATGYKCNVALTDVYGSGSGSANQYGIYCLITGNNTTASDQSGLYAARFDAQNATTGAGDVKGFSGYAYLTNSSATGDQIAVLAITGPQNNGTVNNIGFKYAPSTGGLPKNMAILGDQGLGVLGQLWITSTTDPDASNPSTHLTPDPDNHDAYIEDNLEVDGTVYCDGNLIIPVKTDTGDPTGIADGHLYVNSADNVIKVYEGGAWRTIASW